MEFKKYSSLENSYRIRTIEKMAIVLPNGDNELCQVTEKIHGANFGLYCDGGPVQPASRNNFVDGTFYGCQAVINKYEDAVKNLQANLAIHGRSPDVILYGELAGDGVQGGIKYGEKDFYVFDIKLAGVYLSTLDVEHLCKKHGLTHVPVLSHAMTYLQAIQCNEEFKSKVFECEGDNHAEGLVIKPHRPAYLPNGVRVAVKKKAASFSEVSGTKVKVAKEIVPLSEIDQRMVEDMGLYLNVNRLRAVLSKQGIPTPKEFGKIAGTLLQDALEDFEKDNDIEVKKIADEYKRVSSGFMKAATLFLKPFWVDIIEGEF